MNERIKKLVEQAGFELELIPAGAFEAEIYYEAEFERLVRLAVQEAIHVGALAFANDSSTVPCFPAKQIREHFGVDE